MMIKEVLGSCLGQHHTHLAEVNGGDELVDILVIVVVGEDKQHRVNVPRLGQ